MRFLEVTGILVQVGQPGDGVGVVWILPENVLKRRDGHLGVLLVFFRLRIGDEHLGVCRPEIDFRHSQVRVQLHGLLEVVDRIFIVSVSKRAYSLVQVVAGLQFRATG